MNLLGPALVRDLVSLIREAEADEDIQVVVFASAAADYFIAHVDVTRVSEYREAAIRLAGEPSLGLLFRRVSESRLVTIASNTLDLYEAMLALYPNRVNPQRALWSSARAAMK